MLFTCLLGQLLSILQNGEEVWVPEADVFFLVTGIKAVFAVEEIENRRFGDVGGWQWGLCSGHTICEYAISQTRGAAVANDKCMPAEMKE